MKSSEELAKYYQKQADNIRLSSNENNQNARYDIMGVELNRLPPTDLNKYIKELIDTN